MDFQPLSSQAMPSQGAIYSFEQDDPAGVDLRYVSLSGLTGDLKEIKHSKGGRQRLSDAQVKPANHHLHVTLDSVEPPLHTRQHIGELFLKSEMRKVSPQAGPIIRRGVAPWTGWINQGQQRYLLTLLLQLLGHLKSHYASEGIAP